MKFSHNSYDALKEQHFLQQFFFVTDILRVHPIEAVTSPNTQSFYSICSTRKYCTIEVREVSCVCDSCLYRDGSDCPNKAYHVSQWKPINLKTGKVLLDDKFVNTHWGCESIEVEEESNADVFLDCFPVDVSEEDEPVASNSLDVEEIFAEISNLNTFRCLEEYFDNLTACEFESLVQPIKIMPRNVEIDQVAKFSMPSDCPNNLVPVVTQGDGNCFPRAISRSLFGNESKHREIRLHILIECIQNKHYYLDNEYLSKGVTHIHGRGTFPQQYALFSGQYIPAGYGDIEEIVETIYEREVVTLKNDGAFMGMWQLWAASNLTGRPIRSVFPNHGSTAFRADFNRLIVPVNTSLQKKKPLHIMWTPMHPHGDIIHFVPLLKKQN